MTRQPALQCHAKIEFLNQKPPFESGYGRWSESHQPSELPSYAGRLSAADLKRLRYQDIYPGREEILDVAIKFYDEEMAMVFDNQSYFVVNPKGYQSLRLTTSPKLISMNKSEAISLATAEVHRHPIFEKGSTFLTSPRGSCLVPKHLLKCVPNFPKWIMDPTCVTIGKSVFRFGKRMSFKGHLSL